MVSTNSRTGGALSGGAISTGGATILGGSKATGGMPGSGGIVGTGGIGTGGGTGSGGAGGKIGTGGSAGGTGGSIVAGSGGSIGGSGGGLGWAVRTADSILSRNPNPDTIASSSFSWEIGYTMWSLEKVWRSTQDPKYFAYLKKYVDQHVNAAGSVSGFSGGNLDNFLPGYAILLLYEETQGEQ